MPPSIIILSVIIIAILALLSSKSKIGAVFYRYLLFYLCANFTFEVIAFILTANHLNNMNVYNIEMIVEVTFFILLYKKVSVNATNKKLLAIAAVSFVGLSIVNMIFLQNFNVFNSNTYALGSFILIFACCFYLFDSVMRNEEINPLFTLMFWISLGVLFCYLGNLPFLSKVSQLFASNKDMALRLRVISISVNVLLYLLITVGILCHKTN